MNGRGPLARPRPPRGGPPACLVSIYTSTSTSTSLYLYETPGEGEPDRWLALARLDEVEATPVARLLHCISPSSPIRLLHYTPPSPGGKSAKRGLLVVRVACWRYGTREAAAELFWLRLSPQQRDAYRFSWRSPRKEDFSLYVFGWRWSRPAVSLYLLAYIHRYMSVCLSTFSDRFAYIYLSTSLSPLSSLYLSLSIL